MSSALPSALLSVDDLAEMLGVPRRFVYRIAQERRIPYFKCGRYLRFDPADVEEWLTSTRVDALVPPLTEISPDLLTETPHL